MYPEQSCTSWLFGLNGFFGMNIKNIESKKSRLWNRKSANPTQSLMIDWSCNNKNLLPLSQYAAKNIRRDFYDLSRVRESHLCFTSCIRPSFAPYNNSSLFSRFCRGGLLRRRPVGRGMLGALLLRSPTGRADPHGLQERGHGGKSFSMPVRYFLFSFHSSFAGYFWHGSSPTLNLLLED